MKTKIKFNVGRKKGLDPVGSDAHVLDRLLVVREGNVDVAIASLKCNMGGEVQSIGTRLALIIASDSPEAQRSKRTRSLRYGCSRWSRPSRPMLKIARRFPSDSRNEGTVKLSTESLEPASHHCNPRPYLRR